jgi:hypothetical protein
MMLVTEDVSIIPKDVIFSQPNHAACKLDPHGKPVGAPATEEIRRSSGAVLLWKILQAPTLVTTTV